MGRERHQKRIGLEVAPDTERRVEGAALRAGQEVGLSDDRSEELMHAGESELRLGLDAHSKQRLRARLVRARASVVQECRLSDASLAGDQDHPTPHVIDESVQLVSLRLTPNQMTGRAGATQSARDAHTLDIGRCSHFDIGRSSRLTKASRSST